MQEGYVSLGFEKNDDMAINVALLNKICTTPGAPGFEQRIRSLVLDEIKDLAGTTGDGIVETFNKPSSADSQTNSVADPIAKSRS